MKAIFNLNLDAMSRKDVPESLIKATANQFKSSQENAAKWQQDFDAAAKDWAERRDQAIQDQEVFLDSVREQQEILNRDVNALVTDFGQQTIANGTEFIKTNDQEQFAQNHRQALESAQNRFGQAIDQYTQAKVELSTLKSEHKELLSTWKSYSKQADYDRMQVSTLEPAARTARENIANHYLTPGNGKAHDNWNIGGSHETTFAGDYALKRDRTFVARQEMLTEAVQSQADPLIKQRLEVQRQMEYGAYRADQNEVIQSLCQMDRSKEIQENTAGAKNAAVRAATLDLELEKKGIVVDCAGTDTPAIKTLTTQNSVRANGLANDVKALKNFQSLEAKAQDSALNVQDAGIALGDKEKEVSAAHQKKTEAKEELVSASKVLSSGDKLKNYAIEAKNRNAGQKPDPSQKNMFANVEARHATIDKSQEKQRDRSHGIGR